jgi:hypothetical protein
MSEGYVYFIGHRIAVGDPVKIGFSVNPAARLRELQTGNPKRLIVLAAVEGPRSLERDLHRRFEWDHIDREWFEQSDEMIRLMKRSLWRSVEPGMPNGRTRRPPDDGSANPWDEVLPNEWDVVFD